jgi:branched-chain amino acid transport system substrate-binding protein
MYRLLAVASILVAAALSNGAHADVSIAVAAPMTGTNAWAGEQLQRGAEMAVADINAAGGVLGQQVRLISADDSCDPQQAIATAQKLVNDGAIFVVGHGCSGASIPASKIYNAAGVLQISPMSTNPMFTDQGFANVFRTIGRDDMQGIVAGNRLADHWSDKKIAILNDNTTYGKGLAEETKKQLNKRGVTEAVFKAYTPGKSDYSAEISELQAAGVSALYIGGYYTEAALMVRAARDRGYVLQLVSGDSLSTEDFDLIAGPAGEGALFTFAPDARRNAEATSVVKRFRAENFEPEGYTLATYAAVQAWAQAAEKAKSLDIQAVIASLHSQQFDTVLGRKSFDSKGDITGASWVWYVWKGGKYAQLE